MMKKILTINEKDYIENILSNDLYIIEDKPIAILQLLAQYYYQIKNIRKKGLTEKLIDFMADRYPKYDKNKKFWNEVIEKISRKTGGNTLLECDGIPITESELARINEIENIPDKSGADKKSLQRLLFTILVFGKYQRLKNPKNINGYINIGTLDLFQLARVSGNTKKRMLMLNELYKMGLIDFPSDNGKDNCRVTFIDDSTETKIIITDLREIGYRWNQLHGDNFITCSKCGKLVKPNGGKNGMCKDCAETANLITARCVDCGKLFVKDKRTAIRVRCSECQDKRNKAKKIQWKKQEKLKSA